MNALRLLMVLSTLMLAGNAAFASDKEDKAKEVPKSVGQEPKQVTTQSGELKWSLGGGFIASPRPYVGTKARVFPIPAVNVQYKRFFFQGVRGGFDLVRNERWVSSIFAQARFRGLEPEDSAFLTGMQERKKSMDGGAEVYYQGRPVGFRIGFVTDMLGRSNGQEVSFTAITGAPLGPVLVLVGAGPRWLSQNRVDYYYGVRDEEATPIRPAYKGEATWNLDVNLTTIWRINSRWTFFALLNREGFGSGIENSPLVDRTSAYSLVTSLTVSF